MIKILDKIRRDIGFKQLTATIIKLHAARAPLVRVVPHDLPRVTAVRVSGYAFDAVATNAVVGILIDEFIRIARHFLGREIFKGEFTADKGTGAIG